MLPYNNKILSLKKDADTTDIIDNLIIKTSEAVKQWKVSGLGIESTDFEDNINWVINYLKSNIRYKKDGFDYQDIRSPGRLIKDKAGDCKSFSLFVLSYMLSKGFTGGYRFAGYQPNRITHVYDCFYINNKLYTFDPCIIGSKEQPYKTVRTIILLWK